MIDSQSSAIFTLWDDTVTRLTGYTVQQVNDLIAIRNPVENSLMDQSFPTFILQPFIGKELLFKLRTRDLKLSSSILRISVSKICADEAIISKFKDEMASIQEAFDNHGIGLLTSPTVRIF